MVRRAGRDVVPLEIYKSTYDILKKMATARGMNAKAFVNSALQAYVEKEEFLKERFPGLSLEAAFGNRFVIKDLTNREFVDVYLTDFDTQCEKDRTNHCTHTKFVWLLPEVASLLKRLETREGAEKLTQTMEDDINRINAQEKRLDEHIRTENTKMKQMMAEDIKTKQAHHYESRRRRRIYDAKMNLMKQTTAQDIEENDQALKRPHIVPKHIKEP